LNLLAYRGQGKNAATINVSDLAKKKVLGSWEVDDIVSEPFLGGFSEKGVLVALTTKDRAEGGRLIVSTFLLIWPPPYDKPPAKIECGPVDRIAALVGAPAISRDGQYVAVGTEKGTIEVYDVKSKKLHRTLRHTPKSAIGSVAFSPDGRLFAALARRDPFSGELLLYDTKTYRLLEKVAGVTLVFSPDGKRLATSARDGTKLWKILHAPEK
jgi:hypothetical protein